MMMDGLDHPKTLDLAARLDASIPQVIGHLELLWAFVAQKTPTGNIGKWPDGTIARAAQWTGDATTFVNALVNSGFLDPSSQHRYVVHDWPDHCPRWIHAKLKKTGQSFARADSSTDSRADQFVSRADCSADCRADSSADSMPSHATPSQAKPKTFGTSANADDTERDDGKPKNARYAYPDEFELVWAAYPKRDGPNNKRQAFKAFKARRREGVTAEEMLAGVKRYVSHLDATGRAGTAYVKQASTFFGPDAHFADEYEAATPDSANIWRDAV